MRWCGTGLRKWEVGGVVYRVRAQVKEDGRVQVTVRGGGEAVGELVAPADHLSRPGPGGRRGGPGIRRAGLDGDGRQAEAPGRLHALD